MNCRQQETLCTNPHVYYTRRVGFYLGQQWVELFQPEYLGRTAFSRLKRNSSMYHAFNLAFKTLACYGINSFPRSWLQIPENAHPVGHSDCWSYRVSATHMWELDWVSASQLWVNVVISILRVNQQMGPFSYCVSLSFQISSLPTSKFLCNYCF